MIRDRNLYTHDKAKTTFDILLEIEQFYSSVYMGIYSHNASSNDIEQASNTFLVSPSLNKYEGDVFHLLIDVDDYNISLWKGYRPKKYQNSEQKKRQRTISQRKCPLP